MQLHREYMGKIVRRNAVEIESCSTTTTLDTVIISIYVHYRQPLGAKEWHSYQLFPA